MMKTGWKPAVAVACLALGLGLAPGLCRPGLAAQADQSENGARRESQRLVAQVADLQRELDAARKRIAELEAEIAQLKAALAALQRAAPGTAAPAAPGAPGTVAPPAPAPPRVTIDESIPDASPNALLRALEASYQDAMHEHEVGEPQDRARVAYMRAVDRWARRVNRDFKSQIEWRMRVAEMPGPDNGGAARLQAVDPVTDVPLGDPIDVVLPRSQLARLATLVRRGDVGVLVVKGVLSPNVVLNPSRADKGAFDSPRLIGPFAEFDPRIEVSSLNEPEPEPKPEPPAPR